MCDGRPFPPVEQAHAHEHVGNGHPKTAELDALAPETIGSGFDEAAFHERICQLLHVGLSQIPHAVGEPEHDRQVHARHRRRAPKHAVLSRRGLRDLEIGGPRLVGRRDRDREHHAGRAPDQTNERATHGGPSPDGAGISVTTDGTPADCGSPKAGRRTVYFARICSYALCHASRF